MEKVVEKEEVCRNKVVQVRLLLALQLLPLQRLLSSTASRVKVQERLQLHIHILLV